MASGTEYTRKVAEERSRKLPWRQLLCVLAAASISACKTRVPLAERDVQVTPTPIVLHFDSPYEATGPTRELCFTVASMQDKYGLAPQVLTAVLIRTTGQRDTLGHYDAGATLLFGSGRYSVPEVIEPDDDTVCFWDHGLSNPENAKHVRYGYDSAGHIISMSPAEHRLPPLTATYTEVELSSLVPLRVHRVTLWTGQRVAFP